MLRAIAYFIAVFGLVVVSLSPSHAAKRVALVIGNSAYEHTSQLANPKNDASDMAVALKRLGFDVTTGLDLTKEKFFEAVYAFSDKLFDADVALFFYAGLGVQYQNVNYLIPVDAALRDEFHLKRETIALGDIIELMEGRVPLNLVFLDASRNNPLADSLKRSLRSKGRAAFVGRGLARIEGGGKDTLITFAATPGAIAADGAGRNSPFTAALLKHMVTPGVEIEVMMKRVIYDVRRATSSQQEPERLSQLATEFYFKPPTVMAKRKAPEEAYRRQAEMAKREAEAAYLALTGAGGTGGSKSYSLASGPTELKKSQIEADAALPRFPWPPPEPSARMHMPREPFQSASDLDAVSALLLNPLREAGYWEYSFHRVDNGFALVTRLERINDDGSPMDSLQRYQRSTDAEPFSLSSYIKHLFFAPQGYYRVIIFIVTDRMFAATGAPIKEKEATKLLHQGANVLPPEYKQMAFTEKHGIDVLIYEYLKGQQDRQVSLLLPGRLSPKMHFDKSGLTAAFDWRPK